MKYIIEDKKQFWQYQEAFRQLSRGKLATIEDHILYNLMRGKDLKHGFTPITNEKKLNADAYKRAWINFDNALVRVRGYVFQRASYKSWWKEGMELPFCMKYGETVAEAQWDAVVKALGEYK